MKEPSFLMILTGTEFGYRRNYKKASSYFNLKEKELSLVFQEIIEKCIIVMNSLASHVLTKDNA
ncbi:MAG: hypothetical protein KAH01_01845 [Caldisericia bacterium]|nr:hypothetical protein [Caldisericia bacterium]